MKRLLLLLVLLVLPVVIFSQNTTPVTTFFKIAKEVQARRLSGDPISFVTVVGDLDTLQVIRVYGIAIDSVNFGYNAPATVFRLDVSSGTRSYSYYDTLRNSQQHIVPAPVTGDTLGIQDSVFKFVLASTVPDGEIFELVIRETGEVRFIKGIDSLNTN